ncbi:MAG: isopenicillin N synthase family dioxygenase [Pseudobdellovibrionaceae bacterium]
MNPTVLMPERSIKSEAAHPTLRKVPQLSLMSYIEGSELDRQKFIDNLFSGMKDYGFIVLKEHPISSELLNRAYELIEEYFNLPVEAKMKYALPDNGFQRGYTPFGKEHAKNAKVMDLKEFWHVGREINKDHKFAGVYPQNLWPMEVPEFRAVLSKIYVALEQTGKILLQAMTGPLDVPYDYFDKLTEDGNSILRLLHYPPVPKDADPRCLRAAPHEDINLITILVSATTSGLQLKDRDGTWIDIESDPNSLIVDSGDMLSRITNEVIPSTTHQVVNVQTGKSRYSMPFFMHPNPEAMLSCLNSCKGNKALYPDILAQEFLMQRLREIGLIK